IEARVLSVEHLARQEEVHRGGDQPERLRLLGGLSAVTVVTRAAIAAWLLLASVGCDEKQDVPQAVRDRSNAVTASGPEATAPTASAPKVAAAAKRKELCTSKPDRQAPKTAPRAVAAPDGRAPALPLPFG